MIVKFKKALPWSLKEPGEHARRQTQPHETVGINPTEVQMVEGAPDWTDKASDYWCSAITFRKPGKDARPVIVVGKAEEVIKKLNGESAI